MEAVIRRLSLEVRRRQTGDGQALRREVEAWAQGELLPELERFIDGWPETETVVHVDRLAIEVGTVDSQGWQAALLERVKQELPKLLSRHVDPEPPGEESRQGSGEGRLLDALRYYLEHGLLPWDQVDVDSFEAATQAWLDQASGREVIDQLFPRLGAADSTKRFVRCLSSQTLWRILQEAMAIPTSAWSEWETDLRTLRDLFQGWAGPSWARAPGHDLPEAFWVALFVQVAAAWRPSGAADSVSHGPARGQVCFQAVDGFVRTSMEEALAAQSLSDPSQPGAPGAGPAADMAARFVSPEFRQAVGRLDPRIDAGLGREDDGIGELDVGPAKPRQATAVAQEGHFIAHAGLILLAPYLRMFLERLGHVRDRDLVDGAAALAAVQFLATGQEVAPPEYELVLPKILCGFPLDEAPPPLPKVDDGTVEEAARLLESIVEHWSILRNTSADGLREAFLQRPGKLSLTDRDTWLLQVEAKPYDMLLGYLPWSYRMTRLPWMERRVVTEWVH